MGCGCASERTLEDYEKHDKKDPSPKAKSPLLPTPSGYQTEAQTPQSDLSNDLFLQKTSLSIGDFYQIQRVMRETTGEKVYFATYQATNKPVIIHQFAQTNRLKALSELGTAIKLDHANVLRLYEGLEDQKYCCLVYEYFSSDLAACLMDFGQDSELKVGKIAYQVTKAIKASHTKGIIHNRINLHNIVIKIDQNTGEITAKLTVYSTIHEKNSKKLSPFSAPETVTGEITSKCDVWSLGVIMYTLLCGKTGLRRIHTDVLNFPPSISVEVQQLIKRMLAVNPLKRLSADQVLATPWLQQFSEQPSLLAKPVRNAFKRLAAAPTVPNPIKDAVALFVLHRLRPEYEVESLGKVFTAIDKDGDGVLKREELIAAWGKLMPAAQVKSACQDILSRRTGVSLSQFLLAASTEADTFTAANVDMVFTSLDKYDLKVLTEESCKPLLCLLRDVEGQQFALAIARSGELSQQRFRHLCMKA